MPHYYTVTKQSWNSKPAVEHSERLLKVNEGLKVPLCRKWCYISKTWNSGLPLSWWDLFLSGRWCPSRIGVISPALKSIISQLHSVHCLCSHSVLHKPANDRTDAEVTKEMSTYTKHSRCQSSPNACTPLPALTACTHDPHLITPAQHIAHNKLVMTMKRKCQNRQPKTLKTSFCLW